MTMTAAGNGTFAPPLPSTALAKRSDEDLFRFGLEPQGFTEALKLCETIAETGMFSGNKDGSPAKPAALLVRLMYGRALGIPAMVALNHVFDVYGRPSVSSRLKSALTIRHPECLKFELLVEESNDRQAVYLVQREGREAKKFKFTLEEAAKAQLVKKDSNWEKWPRRMLEARAASHASDVEFPEAAMGLPTHEEAEEVQEGELRGEIVPPQVPTRDWAKEAEGVKATIREAFASKDEGKIKAARATLKGFLDEAPGSVGADVKKVYNEVAPKGAAPAAAAASGAKATPASGATPAPKGAYLPPDKRGDSYDGPEDPPDGVVP